MSGTNFRSGVATRIQYAGSTSSTDKSDNVAGTKLIRKTAVIRCDAQTSETVTGFTLPAIAIVHDVMINVITIDDTETVDVGTTTGSNDPNGFIAAASLGVTGIIIGALLDGSVTRGVLLFEITEATTAAARNDDTTSSGSPVSYTCSSGSDTAIFDIIIDYSEVVVEV